MMPLGELGLVAVVVAGLEVRGQGALNRLCRHFCCVLCRKAGGKKKEIGFRLKLSFVVLVQDQSDDGELGGKSLLETDKNN
jgi:hypothetical protein